MREQYEYQIESHTDGKLIIRRQSLLGRANTDGPESTGVKIDIWSTDRPKERITVWSVD